MMKTVNTRDSSSLTCYQEPNPDPIKNYLDPDPIKNLLDFTWSKINLLSPGVDTPLQSKPF